LGEGGIAEEYKMTSLHTPWCLCETDAADECWPVLGEDDGDVWEAAAATVVLFRLLWRV